MVYSDYVQALQAAKNIVEAHSMVVFKFIFSERSVADDFYCKVVVPLKIIAGLNAEQNGYVIGFVVDKMTNKYEYVLTRIFQESACYIPRSWHVA